jgi:DNA transposition AAA+ family ATPase
MRAKVSKTSTILAVYGAVQSLLDRAAGVPGMGLFVGDPGVGKTTALLAACKAFRAVYVRAEAMGSASSLMGDMCFELCIDPPHSRAARFKALCAALRDARRPVFVDEIDYLLKANDGAAIEMLRDLHDVSGAAVVMVGTRGAAARVRKWPQLDQRLLRAVEFGACTLEDAGLLARDLCEVEMDAELIAKLHAEADGNVRRIVTGLAQIEDFARARGRAQVTAAQWGGKTAFHGLGAGKRRSA